MQKKGLTFEYIEDKTCILDEKHDSIITLNDVGTFIWKNLIKPIDLQELNDKIIKKYQVGQKEAFSDLKKLITLMKKHNLIVKIDAP